MRRAAAIALPLAVVFAITLWRSHGVTPRDASAPPNEFSSARAQIIMRELLADGVPHPVGTAANMRVRDRIVERFRALGYTIEVQRSFACSAGGECANVENIFASRGPAHGDAVLLMAHYDSVGAGPGASDDTMGVAALLEVARAMQKDAPRNPVQFLITDGEEAGLLGAEAFVNAPQMRDVSVVVNVENRGTFGGSNMFETSSGNRWLVRHLANALPTPQATSFFYAIYTLLPNDTDVTVFKRAGKASINFAAIRGVSWYHTPLDDVAHASPLTLQHHGENVLSVARVLAAADLDARSSSDATYFDILGFTLVWWPQEWTLWIAVISLLLLVAAARRVPPRAMTFGVLTAFTAIAFAGIGGFAVSWLARVRSGGANWVAQPVSSIAAMWLIGFAGALFAAALFRRRSEPLPMLYGIAIVWHTIGIALAVALGGAAFLFVVPAVALTICALAKANEVVTSIVASTVAAIVLFPLGIVLYDALGGRLMLALAMVIGILATFVAPLFASIRNAVIVTSLAVVCAIIAILSPAYTLAKPQRLSLLYVDDPAAPAPRWITPVMTPQLRDAAKFEALDTSITPWNTAAGWSSIAPQQTLPRPIITREEIAGGVRIRVKTQRSVNRITLFFRGGGTVQRVNGVALPPKSARYRERNNDWKYASASAATELVVDVAGTVTEVVASDVSHGLPAAGASLMKAREASCAVPSHEGDLTIVRARQSTK